MKGGKFLWWSLKSVWVSVSRLPFQTWANGLIVLGLCAQPDNYHYFALIVDFFSSGIAELWNSACLFAWTMVNAVIQCLITCATSLLEKIKLLSFWESCQIQFCLGRAGLSFFIFFLASRYLPVLHSSKLVKNLYWGGQWNPAVVPALPALICQVNEMKHGPYFLSRMAMVLCDWVKEDGATRTWEIPVWKTI